MPKGVRDHLATMLVAVAMPPMETMKKLRTPAPLIEERPAEKSA